MVVVQLIPGLMRADTTTKKTGLICVIFHCMQINKVRGRPHTAPVLGGVGSTSYLAYLDNRVESLHEQLIGRGGNRGGSGQIRR